MELKPATMAAEAAKGPDNHLRTASATPFSEHNSSKCHGHVRTHLRYPINPPRRISRRRSFGHPHQRHYGILRPPLLPTQHPGYPNPGQPRSSSAHRQHVTSSSSPGWAASPWPAGPPGCFRQGCRNFPACCRKSSASVRAPGYFPAKRGICHSAYP